MNDSDSPSPQPILQARGLIRAYRQRRVLDGVDLTIQPGERVALMGRSGSGKTTLLNCLGGLDRPDQGTITLAGTELTDLNGARLAEQRRHAMGMVFQFFHLLPTLTAEENIALPLQLTGKPAADRKTRVDELVERIGLQERRHAYPGELSGGEMQRVALARAIAAKPRILFADEPTGNLDSTAGNKVLALLEELAREEGTALLLITHEKEATRICERVLQLQDGKLVN